MSGVIQEQALRAVMEYEHKKGGKTLSKGYSYGDWGGFTHMIQVKPKMKMDESVFDMAGNLIYTKSYQNFGYVMAKITEWLIKRR